MGTEDEKHIAIHRDVSPDDLRRIRTDATDLGRAAGLDEERIQRFALAVHEAAANSIEHAGSTGEVTLVQDDRSALYADVTDRGPGIEGALPGRLPSPGTGGGRGLWLSGHLSDHMRVDTGASGTWVHLEMTVGEDGSRRCEQTGEHG